MDKNVMHIFRIGLGVTFAWVGVLIIMHPDVWRSFLQPWALAMIPAGLEPLSLTATGVLDIVVGLFLIINVWTWFFAFLGALHLITVFIAAGITDVTVRDVGLFTSMLALGMQTLPAKWKKQM